MSEWKEYRLGDILSIKSGFSYKGKFIGSGESLLLGMGCVSFKEKFLMSGARPYSGPYDKRYQVYPGDIVLATRQQSDNLPILAMPAMIPKSLEGKDIVIGTNLYKVEIADKSFPNDYIFWLLKTRRYVNYIAGVKTGTTVSMVTKKNVEDFTFFAPINPEERKEIASAIVSLDDKIAVNRRICENLEAQAQALFKHWFIDFAPFKDGKFVESELGMIPEGWKVGKLEDLCIKVGSGGTPKSSNKNYYQGVIPWFGTGEFNDSFLFDSEKHITKEAIDNSSARLYPMHTILIAMYGATVGKLSIISVDATFNQAALALVAHDYIGYPYVFLSLLNCRKALINLACGAAQQNLNAGNIKSFKSIIPNKKVMGDFNDIILPLFELIEEFCKENLRLSTLRDTLLPKLMSGQIKV